MGTTFLPFPFSQFLNYFFLPPFVVLAFEGVLPLPDLLSVLTGAFFCAISGHDT